MLGTKYRGRRKGVPVRAGSVEQARREARLSLAQVASGSISRTAIHLIEKGRTKPSLETLQLIARQTHKPIEYFLVTPEGSGELAERRSGLAELERLIARRDFQGTVDAGLALLGRRKWTAEDTALFRFYVGQAYCRLVRPTEALQHLPPARAEFERLGDEWMAVEALDWESSALGLIDDPEALPSAHSALERCRRLEPSPQQTEARILGHIAGMHVVAESWSQAIRYYQAAVVAASGVKDLQQLAKMHHGLAGAYMQMRQPTTAREHLDKALTLYAIESDLAAACRVENDLGILLLEQGQLDSAEQHLLKALAGSNELNMDRRGRGHILASLGEVKLRRGQLAAARDYLDQARVAGEAVYEGVVVAGVRLHLAEIEELSGHPDLADDCFEAAIRILEELGMPDRLRDAHMAYAKMLMARQDIYAAAVHWKLSAEIGKQAALGLRWTPPAVEAAAGEDSGDGGPAA